MNSEYFQKKRKLEKKGIQIKDDFSSYYGDSDRIRKGDYEEWNFSLADDDTIKGFILGSILFGIALIIGAVFLSSQSADERLEKAKMCKEEGGEYIVIDQKSSYRSKIDIYGCVKLK